MLLSPVGETNEGPHPTPHSHLLCSWVAIFHLQAVSDLSMSLKSKIKALLSTFMLNCKHSNTVNMNMVRAAFIFDRVDLPDLVPMTTTLLFEHMIAPWWLTDGKHREKVLFFQMHILCLQVVLYHVSLSNSFSFLLCGWKHFCMLKTCVGDTLQQSVGKQVKYATANVLYVIYWDETLKQILFIIWLLYIILSDKFNTQKRVQILVSQELFHFFFISMFICLSKVKCKSSGRFKGDPWPMPITS